MKISPTSPCAAPSSPDAPVSFNLDESLDGFLREHNVRHQVGPGFEPNGHSVGPHIAYFEPTYGNMTIRGSYFRQEDTTTYTDQISFGFSGLSSASLVVENSYFDQDLNYTIRCAANTDCAMVNTVFSDSVGTAAQLITARRASTATAGPAGTSWAAARSSADKPTTPAVQPFPDARGIAGIAWNALASQAGLARDGSTHSARQT